MLQAATPAYRNVLPTAVFTGLRQSELLGLTWADVDLDGGIVRVRRQLDRGGGGPEPRSRDLRVLTSRSFSFTSDVYGRRCAGELGCRWDWETPLRKRSVAGSRCEGCRGFLNSASPAP